MKTTKYVTKNRLRLVKEDTAIPYAKLSSSKKVYEYLQGIYDKDTVELYEFFYVLFLNRANEIIGYSLVGEGGCSAVVADTKKIFGLALRCNAQSIVVSHNHPSGHPDPSKEDIALTRKAVKGGEVLDLPVLDHIIYTPNGYYSFADSGTLN